MQSGAECGVLVKPRVMQSSNAQPEHGEKSKPSQRPPISAGYRTEHRAWTVLLALPLVTFGAVLLLTYTIKPTPINTGDPLYDKYLAWVADDLEDNFNPRHFFPYIRNYYSENEEDYDPLASWESGFKDDPRYWMIRYRHSKTLTDKEHGSWENNIKLLEKARELGVADGAILFILLRELENEVSDDYYYNPPGSPNSLEYIAEICKYDRQLIDEKVGPEHDQLLAELLEVAGDNSLAHYYAAMYDTQRGDYEAAIEHMADGNRAPNISRLRGFPYDRNFTNFTAGNPLADKVLNGSILLDQMSLSLPNFTDLKRMVKLLVANAVANQDFAALDEIHTFACRYGTLGEAFGIFHLVIGLDYAGQVQKGLGNSAGYSPSKPQQADLAKLTALQSQIKGQSRNIKTGFNAMPFGISKINLELLYIESVLSNKKSLYVHTYKYAYDQFIKEQTALAQIKPLFEQMESFNYNTLTWE